MGRHRLSPCGTTEPPGRDGGAAIASLRAFLEKENCMTRKLFWLKSLVVLSAMLALSLRPLHAQYFVPLWDSAGSFVGDSVIFQDANGNLSIGTTAVPAQL